jgi:GNAT superfamily N-acetyltransferase
MENFIQLNKNNIDSEHICCAISDKKCKESYQLKKDWLKQEFENGYIFYRLNERAKVFIEYCPSEINWAPISAPNTYVLNCFWVSGKYKKHGYGKQLLKFAIDDAVKNNKDALVTVVGTKKFHFMSDTKWLLKQGFQEIDKTESGFSLLIKKLTNKETKAHFNPIAKKGISELNDGITVYFSNRCPFSEYHVNNSLVETCKNRNLKLTTIKLEDLKSAQNCPSPATIFSLFYNGKFITTDISACMDSRFDKIVKI